jgi:hypothetical protein
MSQNPDNTQFFMCDGTDVSVHPVILTASAPRPTQRAILSAGGTIAAGTTTLTATTATTSKLYDGQRIVLPNGQVIAIDASAQPLDVASNARFFPVGTTALKISPSLVALTMPATLTYEEFQPFWSVDTANFDSEAKITDFKNFQMNRSAKRKTGITDNFDSDGFVQLNDPILQLCRTAFQLTDAFLKMRFIPPDGQGYEFITQVASDSRKTKDGEGYRCPFKFAPSNPIPINFNLS